MTKSHPKNNNKKNRAKTHEEFSTKNHFELKSITPLTPNQELAFRYYEEGYHLMLHGFAGTGKTFCAMYLAMNQILNQNSVYDKIIVVRSVVPSETWDFYPAQ